jgi:gliding motility-associated-like protein
MRNFCVLLSFLCSIHFTGFGQDCSGSLGENIFPDGSFGSGVANILRTNPGIAPGYNYTTNPPPNDGDYTITNNTTSWGNFATDRVNIRDNSPDPFGYMMVVNASFEPGLFYQRTVEVCGGTDYQLSADVISMNNPANANQFIKPNISFLINGQVVFSTGDVPIDGKWHTYEFSFTSDVQATELELALRNNAPGGFGNDLALDNISFRPCGPSIELLDLIPFCGNQPLNIQSSLGDGFDNPVFQWQASEDEGNSWITIPEANEPELSVNQPVEGNQYRLLVANTPENITRPSCRIVSNFSTLAYRPNLNVINAQICEGDTYQLNGQSYTQEGTYEQLLTAANGCDSLIQINLNYGDPRDLAITGDAIVCDISPAELDAGVYAGYAWSTGARSRTITVGQAGEYSVTVTNELGCTGTTSFSVRNSELSAQLQATPPDCLDGTEWEIEVVNIQNGFPPFQFRLDDGAFQESPRFTDLDAGTYEVSVQDQTGCAYSESIELEGRPRLSVTVEAPPEILLGDTLLLSQSTNRSVVSYAWSPEEGFSCTDCSAPIFRPLNSDTYFLEVTDEEGCTAIDSFFIEVTKNRAYYAPNVFSPNGDGVNDYFMPMFGNDVARVDNFRIFSRWGNLLFERREGLPNATELRWNGRSNGEVLPMGVYIWTANIVFIDGESLQASGDVMLLR